MYQKLMKEKVKGNVKTLKLHTQSTVQPGEICGTISQMGTPRVVLEKPYLICILSEGHVYN